MKAFLEIECKDPELILKAMEPDIEETDKFNAKLEPKESKIELNENDVKLVAEQTKKSITESRIALQESDVDLAKAILKLKGEKQ